jgi:diguanylate cyclase (GGDEF)-like protein
VFGQEAWWQRISNDFRETGQDVYDLGRKPGQVLTRVKEALLKIVDQKPVAGPRPTAHVGARPQAGAAGSPAHAAPIPDSADVMGIPEAEFTPKVRAAIAGLMAEVRLRRDLLTTQARLTQLEQIADQDTLTPLMNRRAFVRELSRTMSFAERYDTPSSVIYFDVNGLKQINDTLSHAAGDAVLQHIAAILTANVRESDYVGRLGGDEFAIILSHTDGAAAAEKAASLSALVAQSGFTWEGKALPLAVSYGTHSFRGGGDPAGAIDAADRAMYARKRGKVD